jgi:poly-gamma-glutamate synthesis protein (capsule biosynthesis protein)
MRKSVSIKNVIIGFFLILLLAAAGYIAFIELDKRNKQADEENARKEMEANIQVATPKPDETITLTALGDVMCHSTQYEDAYDAATGGYDFNYVFDSIRNYTGTADITMANLETTFAGVNRGYSGYPTFNSPESLGTALKNIGVDILSTANNHSLDKGYTGLENTLNTLDSMSIFHMGTARSKEERDRVLIKTVKGATFAFLSYTYGTNGIPVPRGQEYCVNLIDKDLIKQDLDNAKAQDVDIIVVNMHWGAEYETVPIEEQRDLAQFIFENGADVIIGGHPHVLEELKEKTVTTVEGEEKNVFVVYSLGNFISGQTIKNTNLSIILNIDFLKSGETGEVTIDNIEYRPIYMTHQNPSPHNDAVLDIYDCIWDFENNPASTVNKATYDRLKQALVDIHNIIGNTYDSKK